MKTLIILLLLIIPIGAMAYQPKPVDFYFNQDGEAFGMLEDGSTFSQTNVVIDPRIRLQKFQWGSMFWYISDKGVIFADSGLQALSIYLTRL